MDIVSFATAKRLKEAGFPQPEPAIGQSWYGMTGKRFVVVGQRAPGYWHCAYESHGIDIEVGDFDPKAFAPTATDILRLDANLFLQSTSDGFAAYGDWRELEDGISTENPKASEACAAVWLVKNPYPVVPG